MGLEPHDENDGIPSDDSSESVVERFGFLQEDRQMIQDLIAGVRRTLRRKSITPQQICGLGKLLEGLERLPRHTSGIDITVTIASDTPDHSNYQSISLSESSFEFWNGGTEFGPQGGDNYKGFSFHLEVGGFRDDAEVTEVEEWMFGFINSLSEEDQEFEVDDQEEGSVLDWDEKTPEDDWDQLDSEY